MNKPFSTKILIFVVILVHVTILDFMFVNSNGLVLLPEKNLQLQTVAVHIAIALVTTLVYWFTEKVSSQDGRTRIKVKEPMLILLSVAMAISIGYLLLV